MHRGPDELGTFYADNFAMGITRLAIVNVDFGQQPVQDLHNKYVVVFNGEIYNFRELRKIYADELRKYWVKSTISEAELIAFLFNKFDKDFVHKLRGMFAIAIWNKHSSSLTLIRDRFGEKPVWYYHREGQFLFASEIKAFKSFNLPLTLNLNSINDIFQYGYICPPKSIFNEIHCVPAGSILTVTKDGVDVSKYWNLYRNSQNNISKMEAYDSVESALSSAVELQCYSERDFGLYLSGGVDSSLIAFYLQNNFNTPIKTYSIDFHELKYDESEMSLKVSKVLGTNHKSFFLDPSQENLKEVFDSLDQPFADSSFFATYFLNKFAREDGIVVAFGGDGGDESFIGYDRYRAIYLAQRFALPIHVARVLISTLFSPFVKRNRIFKALSLSDDLSSLYEQFIVLNNPHFLKNLINTEFQYNSNPMTRGVILSEVEDFVRFDLNTYLPGDILVKSDLASMANSIELRSPFLDHEYFQTAASIPLKYRVNTRHSKILLKEIATKNLKGIDFYRKKMGFGIPRAEWLRGPLAKYSREILLGDDCKNRGWLNQNYLREIIDEHELGADHDNVIWPALVLESWANKWF